MGVGVALVLVGLSIRAIGPGSLTPAHPSQPEQTSHRISAPAGVPSRVDPIAVATPPAVDHPQSPAGRDFAAEADAALALPPERQWSAINATYYTWGRQEPEIALQSALAIAPSEIRRFAIESALSGWSRTAPGDLAEAAMEFPEGAEKHAALTKAIRAWLIADPDRAGAWIDAHRAVLPIAEAIIRNENR